MSHVFFESMRGEIRFFRAKESGSYGKIGAGNLLGSGKPLLSKKYVFKNGKLVPKAPPPSPNTVNRAEFSSGKLTKVQ